MSRSSTPIRGGNIGQLTNQSSWTLFHSWRLEVRVAFQHGMDSSLSGGHTHPGELKCWGQGKTTSFHPLGTFYIVPTQYERFYGKK